MFLAEVIMMCGVDKGVLELSLPGGRFSSIYLDCKCGLPQPLGTKMKDEWVPVLTPICLHQAKADFLLAASMLCILRALASILFELVQFHGDDLCRVTKMSHLISLGASSDLKACAKFY